MGIILLKPPAPPANEVDLGAVVGFVVLIAMIVGVIVIFALILGASAKKQRARAQQAAQEQHARMLQAHQAQQYYAAQEEANRRAGEAELARRQQERLQRLAGRFGSEAAQRIMKREFWQGQTMEMLIESLGAPADVDERVMKNKTRQVYKYRQTGVNRFALRVTLEDGVVVGWEDKS